MTHRSYIVSLTPRAERALKKLPAAVSRRLVAQMEVLETDPRPNGATKLTDTDLYRIRDGDYRIIYTIDDGKLMVLVVHLGNRRDVYR
jgi:mRNA interferase RelE/StbE